ncbi:unnamed protein product [Calypogeia fissa]
MGVNCIALEPPQDGDPKRPHTTSTYEAHMWSAAKKMNDSLSVIPEKTIDEVLPEAMLMEILSRLPDAWDLANCAAVNRIFRSTYRHVKVVRFLYKREDSRCKGEPSVSFKETVAGTIQHLTSVENLRLEIEDAMQASRLLKELLMGASEFSTLTNLSSCNQLLEKVFLDVPCMAFEDSGLWKGVLTNDFSRMKLQFSHLELKCDSWKKGLRFECFSF